MDGPKQLRDISRVVGCLLESAHKSAGIILTALLVCQATGGLHAETFTDIYHREHKSVTDRRLVDRSVSLTFDDVGKRLILARPGRPLGERIEVPYDDITKVIFEVTEHKRGMNKKAMAGWIAAAVVPVAGALAASTIAGGRVKDHLCYLERKGGAAAPLVIEMGSGSADVVQGKIRELFAGKVGNGPTDDGEAVDKKTLPELGSKHAVKVIKDAPPFAAQTQAGKALVVVVSPSPEARASGAGFQRKLHANGRVIAINLQGTYGFAYLDPGDYTLVSQAANANGFQITLEEGKEYYFLQNDVGASKASLSGKDRTSLSRHSKDYVLFEVSGAYRSDWKLKPKTP